MLCRPAAAAGWVLVQPLTWSEDMQANKRLRGSSGFRYVIKILVDGVCYWVGCIGAKKGFNQKPVQLPRSTLCDFTPEGAKQCARHVDVELVNLGRGADRTFIVENGVEVARLLVR